MLKIKDNVDLKDLKKYGFISDATGQYKYHEGNIGGSTYCYINVWSRRILFMQTQSLDTKCLSILYDLIVDGLVDKVD